VLFDAYESDLPWIRTGDAVELTIPSRPGETYTADVTFVDPVIDPQTRTAGVRVDLPNPDRELKPEMFARGVLESSIAASSDKLLIPKTAILWTGKRAVVYVRVDSESPTFRYREITLGPEAGDFYVVADGLEAGEEIAVNGVFKIDAAAQLEGKPSMMNPEGGAGSTGHDHGGMEMSGDKEPDLQPEAIPAAFRQQLTQVYTRYLDMTDAFVESNPEQVRQHAGRVLQALEGVDMNRVQGEAHRLWMDQLDVLTETIRDIESASDLESQRETFSEFNLMFYKTVKTFGLAEETVYYQYCPMANRDTGAYWFSRTKEIRNPYFGDAMLQCGETRETIE
jgi:Cu(I)/Ag(I) efflux system membrane fusion protein